MNEYAILAKVKNNLILRRILDAGYPNVHQFCVAHNLQESRIGDWINMKAPAVRTTGRWHDLALRLADILDVMPEDLFTAEQMTARLERNDVYIELTRDAALALTDDNRMQKRLEDADLVGKLFQRAKLRAKERLTLEMMNDGATLAEVAKRFDMTPAGAQQIRVKALNKLRTASRKLQMDQDEVCAVDAT